MTRKIGPALGWDWGGSLARFERSFLLWCRANGIYPSRVRLRPQDWAIIKDAVYPYGPIIYYAPWGPVTLQPPKDA